MKTQILCLLKDYPKQTKEQLRKSLREEGYTHVRYSGKEKGFFVSK